MVVHPKTLSRTIMAIGFNHFALRSRQKKSVTEMSHEHVAAHHYRIASFWIPFFFYEKKSWSGALFQCVIDCLMFVILQTVSNSVELSILISQSEGRDYCCNQTFA